LQKILLALSMSVFQNMKQSLVKITLGHMLNQVNHDGWPGGPRWLTRVTRDQVDRDGRPDNCDAWPEWTRWLWWLTSSRYEKRKSWCSTLVTCTLDLMIRDPENFEFKHFQIFLIFFWIIQNFSKFWDWDNIRSHDYNTV